MKQGIVYRETEGWFRYQGWPSVCADEYGVLYAVASAKRLGHVCPCGKNVMYVSRDGGESWSSPVIVNDTYLDDRDAGIVSLGEGKLLLSWFNLPREFYKRMEENILDRQILPQAKELARGVMESWWNLPDSAVPTGSFVRLSRDAGKTWEAACKVPTSAPHGPIRLHNGKLLYLGKLNVDHTTEATPIAACESTDDGKTWQLLSEVAIPDGLNAHNFHEPHAVELPDGKILGAIRAQGAEVNERENGFTIYFTVSEDGGRTWSMPQATGICGSPPHLMVHSSGAVILTYGRRRAPFGQRARISHDNGKTWSEEIVLNDQGVDGDLGYPATAELPDGSLITVYYQKVPGDRNCSILYTKWKLSEIQS
ncbi:MAG: exo-alpha-sialidase [Clostridia bacterium]|nr:exo-alpha-sialidase [Clostridia bacterium]